MFVSIPTEYEEKRLCYGTIMMVWIVHILWIVAPFLNFHVLMYADYLHVVSTSHSRYQYRVYRMSQCSTNKH